ncbi:MAG: FtsX-like permease family protein, partial [Solirubrobacteraceae bacterium]
IMRSVAYESLMLGVLGGVLGLLAGIGMAPALNELFKAFGAELPDSGTVVQSRTVIVSLLVGVVVTLLAGLPPALRATRVPPIAAMREGVQIPPRVRTPRALVRRFLVLLALAALLGSTIGKGVGIALVVGAVIRGALLGLRLRTGKSLTERVVPLLGHTIGRLVRWRGVTGRLAEENAVRQPGRTIVTAMALTVGLALVAFVAVLASGFKATIDHSVDQSFAGNLIVENSQSGNERGIPPGVATAVRGAPGVANVTAVAFTVGRLHGQSANQTVTAIEPESFAREYRLEWKHGSDAVLGELDRSGAIVTEEFTKKQHVKVGSTFTLLTPTAGHVTLQVRGVIRENSGLLKGITIGRSLAASGFGQREDAVDFVGYAPGAGNAQVQPAVDRVLSAQYPQARSRTAAQFKQDLAGQINTLLTLIYVLLALSVIVSLFGIVNTLILSIYERTRELGMMRAIGTSRRQVRQMIRYESIITALIGGVLGLVIGVLGAVLTTAITLSGTGYQQAIPVGTLVVLLAVAALAGVLAAQAPARRAAKLDLLAALSGE